MTALVVASGVLAVAAVVSLVLVLARERRRSEHLSYAVQWTETDREAHLLELAVQTNRGAFWHRDAKRLEQEKRGLVEQLLARRRRPIPLAPAHNPVPDYGAGRNR